MGNSEEGGDVPPLAEKKNGHVPKNNITGPHGEVIPSDRPRLRYLGVDGEWTEDSGKAAAKGAMCWRRDGLEVHYMPARFTSQDGRAVIEVPDYEAGEEQ
jgi:hypothetical protein